MIIYFHLSKNKEKKREERAVVPWVSNWNREQLVARSRAEIDGHMRLMLMYPLSLSQKKTQRNLQGNNPKGEPKCKLFFPNNCLLSRMESRKRKQILEDSSLESKSESTDE
ncbi:hypothetical protein Ahy_A10g048163 isoform B [Arachis hypogaea]|uniref:Uncharacterized protein n=1 Tax=Arachis hypogaea TaxID=3818 RepID=A0A445B4E0_ARAHY|nr:hypothetical protein Ahy_A10g048163 isoform B [Arachis hypogaea]